MSSSLRLAQALRRGLPGRPSRVGPGWCCDAWRELASSRGAGGDRAGNFRGPQPVRKALIEEFEISREHGLVLNAREGTVLITRLGKEHLWQHAVLMFEDMRQGRSGAAVPDGVAYGAVISACERGSAWPAALLLLCRMSQAFGRGAPQAYSAAASACGIGSRWDLACSLLQTMRAEQGVPNVIVYNAVITACTRGSNWQRGLSLLASMQEDTVAADTVTCNAVIGACRQEGLWEHALSILAGMELRGPSPTSVTYNSVCAVCDGASRWQWSVHLLTVMRSRLLQPNIRSVAAAVGAEHHSREILRDHMLQPAKAGVWPEVVAALMRLRREGRPASAAEFNAAAAACVANQAWKAAMALLLEMCSGGPEPDRDTHAVVASLPVARAMQEPYQPLRPHTVVVAGGASVAGGAEQWAPVQSTRPSAVSPPPLPPRSHEHFATAFPAFPASVVAPVAVAVGDTGSSMHGGGVGGSSLVFRPMDVVKEVVDLEEEASSSAVSSSPASSSSRSSLSSSSSSSSESASSDEAEPSSAAGPEEVKQQGGDVQQEDTPLCYTMLSNGDAIIDLHGLPVEVAKIAVQVALEDLLLGGGPGSKGRAPAQVRDLIIVTGIGKHSRGGVALVRPAVIEFLREHLQIAVLETRTDGPGRLRIPAAELRRLRGVPEPGR